MEQSAVRPVEFLDSFLKDKLLEYLVLLTSEEALHLMSVTVIGHAASGCAEVGHHGGEGQELTAVVIKGWVDSHQAQIISKVPEIASFNFVGTVDLTHINESRESVHLLADSAGTENMSIVSRSASGRRAGEWHAFL